MLPILWSNTVNESKISTWTAVEILLEKELDGKLDVNQQSEVSRLIADGLKVDDVCHFGNFLFSFYAIYFCYRI